MKKSVHLTASAVEYIKERGGEDANYSAAINSAFEQLAHIARSEKPELTGEEFAELCNVYSGSDLTRIALPVNLAVDLMAHYGATIPKQMPGDVGALVERLAGMTQAQQFAILDAVRVFWAAQ